MRRTKLVGVLVVLGLALLLAGPAAAQEKAVVVAAGWAPGYAWGEGEGEFAPLGVMINASFPILPKISILGDIGWQHKSGVDVVEATGGIRYWIPMEGSQKMSPFVEASGGLGYVGVEGFGTGTGASFGAGVGVDVPVPNKNLSFRIQVNYYRFQVSGFGGNAIRFGLGISGKMNK